MKIERQKDGLCNLIPAYNIRGATISQNRTEWNKLKHYFMERNGIDRNTNGYLGAHVISSKLSRTFGYFVNVNTGLADTFQMASSGVLYP